MRETRREEIDRLSRNARPPANLGWRRMEGSLCFRPSSGCDDGSLSAPLLEYSHDNGCAVIGGYRYRGSASPKARGLYLFADFRRHEVRGAEPDEQGLWDWKPVGRSAYQITSFGENEQGEILITAVSEGGGILGLLASRSTIDDRPFEPTSPRPSCRLCSQTDPAARIPAQGVAAGPGHSQARRQPSCGARRCFCTAGRRNRLRAATRPGQRNHRPALPAHRRKPVPGQQSMKWRSSDAHQRRGRVLMSSTPSVLVLGVEHPRDAATIRSLARQGIAVDVADDTQPPTAMWRSSRYIRHKYLLPENAERAVAMLESLDLPADTVLIPTNDQYLILVSKHHERLSRRYRVAVPPWDLLDPLMDKIKCHQLGREVGIDTPRHYCPSSLDELDEIIGGLDFEQRAYVLKIRMWDSGAADPLTLRRVVKGGADARSLKEGCLEIYNRNGTFPVIEEVITGGADRCIGVSMVVDKSHEPVLAYCVQRLKLHTYSKGFFKHPYELGANAYCESVHDEEAVRLATRLVKHARYSGAITVELKRSPVDGELKLIKADVRVVRATRLSSALGLDIPSALYEVFSTDARPGRRPGHYPEGVGWIWLEAYMYSLWKNRRETSLTSELLHLMRRLARIRAFAYFDIRDPLPSLILLTTAVGRLKRLETRGSTGETRPASG